MRLSEFRFVKLIMAISSITNDVNKNILVESLSVFDCEFAYSVDSFWIISIDVNYRAIKRLSDVTAVKRTSSIYWICREANLIVYNHMDGPSNRELRDFTKCE